MAAAADRAKVETITGNGVEIAYVISGPVSGEPVILIHGGEGSLTMYDTFRPLLGHGIRAIAYDQRDTGASHNPAAPYQMEDLADRLGGISVATLLVYSEDDPLAPPSVGQRIAAAIPGSRLEMLPGLRHGITLEGKQTTAALLREFVLAHPWATVS